METPKCEECGKEMTEWENLGIYYCKKCSIAYDPDKDKYWET